MISVDERGNSRAATAPALVSHFVEIYSRRMGKQIENIPAEAISKLSSYEGPGNVRELQNFIERSVILSAGTVFVPASCGTAARSRG
jgi:formate hydrogenlyase transcriptional activator